MKYLLLGEETKRLDLFNLILKSPPLDDSGASIAIYKKPPHSAFSHLKKRLLDDILSFIFVLDAKKNKIIAVILNGKVAAIAHRRDSAPIEGCNISETKPINKGPNPRPIRFNAKNTPPSPKWLWLYCKLATIS